MKLCKRCNEIKEDADFFIRKRNNRPYGYCKVCVTSYTNERLRSYKEESVKYLGGKCVICGYSKYVGALELHHIDPNKKDVNYYSMRNWSFSAKKNEVDKCVLLCSNCHKEVEAGVSKL